MSEHRTNRLHAQTGLNRSAHPIVASVVQHDAGCDVSSERETPAAGWADAERAQFMLARYLPRFHL